MSQQIVQLTIAFEGLNMDELLSSWRWLVSPDYQPVQLSKFGDCMFTDKNGRVFFLDSVEGSLTKIANSISEYNQVKDLPENRSRWFLDGFVFRCEAEGLKLKPDECYGWKVHPAIGGKFGFENIQVFSLSVYQSILGQLAEQFRKLKPSEMILSFKLGSVSKQ